MNKLELTKLIANTVVGLGTTRIVSQVIKNNTTPENVTDTVTITAASFAIGSMVAHETKAYTSAKIDEAAAWWRANVKS